MGSQFHGDLVQERLDIKLGKPIGLDTHTMRYTVITYKLQHKTKKTYIL